MHVGGAEQAILTLAAQLVRRGHGVTVITTAEPGAWFDRIASTGARAAHVEGKAASHPIRHALRCAATVRNGAPDIVIPANSERFAQAALRALPPDVAAIPWIHSDDDDAYRKAAVNRAVWNVAVGVSPKVADAARLRLNRPVVCIPNGVAPPGSAAVVDRQPSNPGQLRLLFVGRLEDRTKGVFLLPEILGAIRMRGVHATLRVVGDGPDRDPLAARFAGAGLAGVVSMVGVLPRDDIFREYAGADMLLAPSRIEGLPTVPIEAQQCGCVPVASRLPGGTDAAIRHGETGLLVDPGDVEAFAQAAVELACDPARRAALARAGERWAGAAFSPEAMARQFVELFAVVRSGAYPYPGRRSWPPVSASAYTWRELIPRAVHRLGLGRRVRNALRTVS